MARQDNPFSLLGDDDDGGDVAALLLKVEAKISAAAAAAAAAAGVVVEEKPKSRTGTDGFLSKPLPPGEFILHLSFSSFNSSTLLQNHCFLLGC